MTPQQVPAEYVEAYSEMWDQFRRGTTGLFIDAHSVTIFRDMPAGYQINAFIAGVMVAVMSILINGTKEEAREKILDGMIAAVPHAFNKAQELYEEAAKIAARDGAH